MCPNSPHSSIQFLDPNQLPSSPLPRQQLVEMGSYQSPWLKSHLSSCQAQVSDQSSSTCRSIPYVCFFKTNIRSMYGIFSNIDAINDPNVGRYSSTMVRILETSNKNELFKKKSKSPSQKVVQHVDTFHLAA